MGSMTLRQNLVAVLVSFLAVAGLTTASAVAAPSEGAGVTAFKSVYYVANGSKNVQIKVSLTNGSYTWRWPDTVTDGVWKWCPPAFDHLVVQGPGGSWRTLATGECYVPLAGQSGQWKTWTKD